MKVTTAFFSRKNKGGPANVLLLYHGVAGQGIAFLKAFPGPFWALSRPAPCSLPGSTVHWIIQAEYWGGLPCPLPGDLPKPGIKPDCLYLLHCRQILYPLNHSWSFSKNFATHRRMTDYIYTIEKQKPTTKITIPSKDLIENWWQNQKLYRQALVKRI